MIASYAIAQGSLNSGLVASFSFSGNANDASGNGNDGSLMNGVSFENDRWNNPNEAIRFNKSLSQYVDVQNSPSLQIDSAISFSCWIKRNILDNGQDQVLNKGGDWINGTCNYGLVFSEGTLVFMHSGGYYIVASPGVPLDYNWHHYAVTALEGTTEIHFYVDGVEKTCLSGAGNPVVDLNPTSSSNLYLSGVNYFSNNTMDELKIYNRILTVDEIKSLYSDLVAYYPFNGNANDESGNGHDGTINGNAALVPDRFNTSDRAFTFPNQSSNISLANSTNLNLESGFTFNSWVKYKNTYSVIIGKHVCGYVNGFVLGIDYDGQFHLLLGDAGWQIVKTSETLVEDRWYMLTATYDGSSGIAKIYLDGQLENSANISYTNFSPYPISIGEVFQNNCSPANMSGAIDEVKIYNRPLNAAEILEEYNNTYTDLVLFLPFNGNANNERGNVNNGIVNGAALTQDRFGIEGRAYSFNGNGDFISIADNPNLFSDELTISWWYKMNEILGGERVVIGWVDGGHRYQQFFNGGQLSYLNGYNVAQPGMYFNPIYGLNDLNVWKNVVVTYQKTGPSTSTTAIYVDGELKQTDNHTLAMDYVSGPDFFIGKNHNGNFLKGYLDDMRIYRRILDSTEIVALYNDSTTYNPPLEDGLVAYWPLNGNTNDSTYNNNDGINHNGVFNKDRFANDLSSIYFDGVDSYVEGINPGNNLPTGNSPRSFSAWVKNLEFNQWGSNIFHYGTAQPAPTNFHFLITDVLGLGNGYGFGVEYGNTNLNDSTWHFVTGVYEGGAERITKLYIDGKLDISGNISTEPNTILGTNWRMGRFMEGGTPFKGNIDEVKVYDIPLTDQQIWDKYKATTTAPNLLFPGNDSTLINPPFPGLILDWDSTITANEYRLLISNDTLFNIIVHDTLLNTSSFDFYDWPFVDIDNLYWKVRTINDGGIGPWSEINHFSFLFTDVENETQLPKEFALLQNYPNPFNPSTVITYHLPKASNVKLKVYDIIGNEIATLVNEEKAAGIYKVNFSSTNLASGVYLYKLQAGGFLETRKMILVR